MALCSHLFCFNTQLQILLPSVYLSVAQFKELLQYFPPYGYLRVMLLQTVFAHLVDLENLWPVIDHVMNMDERYEVMMDGY